MRAVEGGRTIYANITKFVHMMFSHNLGEVLMIFTAIAAGWPLPLLPRQILWMNLVTDVFPALALAMEPASPDAMKQPPRSMQSTFLSRPFLTLVAWQSMLLAAMRLSDSRNRGSDQICPAFEENFAALLRSTLKRP